MGALAMPCFNTGASCQGWPGSSPAQDPPHQPPGDAPPRATTKQVAGLAGQREQQPLLLAGSGGDGPGGVAFLDALLGPLQALLLGGFLLRQGFGLLGRFGLPLGGFGGGGGLGGPLEQQFVGRFPVLGFAVVVRQREAWGRSPST
ncbi:MAG: hypothetical protein WCL59_07740 [Cyanobium sp. ELA507]